MIPGSPINYGLSVTLDGGSFSLKMFFTFYRLHSVASQKTSIHCLQNPKISNY
jgi:hypothetical protein